jgi:hypothetical protein
MLPLIMAFDVLPSKKNLNDTSNGGFDNRKLVWYRSFGTELIAVNNPGNVNKYNANTNSFVGLPHYLSLHWT